MGAHLFGMIGFVGLLAWGMTMAAVILIDDAIHGVPDPERLRTGIVLAAKGMTDSGVPWIAGQTQAEAAPPRGPLRKGAAEPRGVG